MVLFVFQNLETFSNFDSGQFSEQNKLGCLHIIKHYAGTYYRLPLQYGLAKLKFNGNSWETFIPGGISAPNPKAGKNLSLTQKEKEQCWAYYIYVT